MLPLLMIAAFYNLAHVSMAGDWSAFRGSAGNGISNETNLCTTWDPETHIAWKAALPRPGNGSPVVFGERVYLTSAEDTEGKQRSLYCFMAADGLQLWKRTVEFDKVMPTHETNPYCASTPAAQGERVVVWHGSAGLFCYDLDGRELWSRNLGEFRHMWGYASSPVIYQDRVILYCGPGERIFVTAIDLATGKTLWETEEPQQGNGERNKDDKYMGSWATPVIAKVGQSDQAICSLPTRVVAYDPNNGEILWSCDGLSGERGDLAYSSPLISGDRCVAIAGFRGPGIGLQLGGSGNITESSRLWRNEENPQSIASGVFLGKYIYRANAGPGTIDCLEAETGNVVWTERATGASYWASIVAADDHLYALDQEGTTTVFKPNPVRFELVATNKLGEPTNATPAIADGRIFIRTFEHLICIGDAPSPVRN
jgi:outer membrane protein assembly factor BamB